MTNKRIWFGLFAVLTINFFQATAQTGSLDRVPATLGPIAGVQGSMAGADVALSGVASSLDAIRQAASGSLPRPEASVGEVLRSMASRSGVAFVGQVLRVEHKRGFVEIAFAVQQPLVGSVGGTYVLREWSGLWAPGDQRYSPGERAMVFLHSPNAAGMSSPVDGMEGIVPVILTAADEAPLLDVRWLATRVVRPQGAPIVDAENGAMLLADATAGVKEWARPVRPEPVRVSLPEGVQPRSAVPQSSPALQVAMPSTNFQHSSANPMGAR